MVTSSNQTRGTLTVANGQTKLFVTYTANAPWKIREMQVAAASSLSGIPVNQKGVPKVGNFPYRKEFTSTTTYTFNIPLTNLGNPIYIAAHADMSRYWNTSYRDGRGRWHDDWHEERTEVWAQGTRFVQTRGNWAMYFTYAVQPCNQPPAAVSDTATVAEDSGTTTLNVLTNDTDADGDPFTIASASDPAHGTVVVAGDGLSLTYQPDANYCNNGSPTDSFTYTLNPGGSTATVAVTVTCVNDTPVAVNDTVSVTESSAPNAINVLANDTDVEGDPFTIASVTQPANGTVVIAGDNLSLTYQPNIGYCNNGSPTDDFTYTLTPGGSTATVSVSITCVDDAPVAVDDTATVDEDSGTTTLNVLANDVDLDSDPFTIASASDPLHGTVVVSGDGLSLTYEPDANYCNNGTPTDTFTYTITPGGSTATVAVTVTCLDDQPVAVNDALSVAEDASATIVNVLTNDSDADSDPFTIASASDPANGTVVLAVDGLSLTYQPDAGYCNDGSPTDDFTYSLTPGGATATVAVTVVCVDDEPVAINNSTTVDEDSSATTINVLLNDANPDGGPISIASVTQPANGVVSITNSGADLTYTPNANYCNDGTPTDDFTYTLTPGGSTATVAVTVTCVDDAPTTVDDTAAVLEDSGVTTINLLANDSDIDGGINSISSVTQPANGIVTITNGGANVSYEPNANYCNDGSPTDDFTYTVSPGGSVGNVAVTVTCVNDAPSFDLPADPDQSVLEDSGAQTVSGFASNISTGPANESGQTVTFSVSNDNNILFSSQPDIDETSGDLTYTPAAGATGSALVSVYLTDTGGIANGGVDTSATQTFTITVSPLTAPPVAEEDNYSTNVNITISRSTLNPDDLLDNDDLGIPAATLTSFGGGSLGGAVTNNAAGASVALAGGTLTVNADGSFSLTTPTLTGSYTFQYRLTNGSGVSDALVTIEVQGPPDAFDDEPNSSSAPSDAYHAALNTTLDSAADTNTPAVLDNDNPGFPIGTVASFGGGSLPGDASTNAAGDTVNFGSGGSLQMNANGEFIFTPSTDFTGLFTFEYRLTNIVGSDDATVTI
ncbi:MAG TPA: Ig-like domain-containing protein, partial [Anaerolineales bacterium]|nr:Ig-like domain-containing protein [Anaerolineales bacterium]